MRFQDLLRKSVFPARGREATGDSTCGTPHQSKMDDIETNSATTVVMPQQWNPPSNITKELPSTCVAIAAPKPQEEKELPTEQRRKTPPIRGAPQPRQMPSDGRPTGLGGQPCVSAYIPAHMRREHWTADDFVVRKRLYEGYSSVVSQALDRVSGMVVALKVYDKARLSELNRAQVEREIRIHIELQHMYIIQLYAAWEDDTAYYLIQEYAAEGDVFTEVHRRGGQLSEKAAVNLVLQPFLAALHYLHMRNIIHRDIKPENLLFANQKIVKVADFGLAINYTQERPVTRAGTLDYMAPEVIVCPSKKHPEENKDKLELTYTEKIDSWSVGILAYELIVGFPPFERESRTATLEGIMYTEAQFPRWMSEDARDFIKKALCKSCKTRPSIPDMLRHPWIQIHERRRSHRTIPTDFLPWNPIRPLEPPMGFEEQNEAQQQQQQQQQPQPHRQTTSFGPQSLFGPHLNMLQLPFSNLPDHSVRSPQAPGSPLAGPGSPLSMFHPQSSAAQQHQQQFEYMHHESTQPLGMLYPPRSNSGTSQQMAMHLPSQNSTSTDEIMGDAS